MYLPGFPAGLLRKLPASSLVPDLLDLQLKRAWSVYLSTYLAFRYIQAPHCTAPCLPTLKGQEKKKRGLISQH